MASVQKYQTQAGTRWKVRYRTPRRTTTEKRGFATKRDAEAFAASVEVSKLRGEFIEAGAARATVGALAGPWEDRQGHLKPSALRPVRSALRVHVLPRWGSIPVAEVRATDVQQWVTELGRGRPDAVPPVPGKSATTVARAYGVLAAILDDAVADRRIVTNPARGVKLPKKTPKPRVYLTHEQVHAFAAASKYPTLVLVLAYTGLRWGEASALRVRHLDMLRRRIKVEDNAVDVGGVIHVGTPKTHRVRVVPFPRFLGDALAAQCAGKGRDDLVFPGPGGGYMSPARVHEGHGSWWGAAVRAAGVPRVTPHDLRHTAASFAVSAGANVKAVQRMLGHASAAMTLDVYADLFDEDLNAVADRLDAVVAERIALDSRLVEAPTA